MRSLSVLCLIPAPWQIGPLLPPKVISTIITLRGNVTRFVFTHQYRNCSLVVAQPTRTSDLVGSSFKGPSSVIELSNVGLSPKRMGQRGSRDSTLGSCAAWCRLRVDMSIHPLSRAKTGDQEWR
ncbi:hypothetical protein BDV41DRAFT_531767 [Aspergillus transmontanensis]|uniref:Uncharacterized protein n=1 Tax=Aspergillus transmontanensis TaxID=1034304 RepID=A0A5N6W3D3_9EURO|nr:hypothetical protein BDV41DRAFT_531767 [Aspergillus transmontanensis]